MKIKDIIDQITDAYPDMVKDDSTVPHGLVEGLLEIEKSLSKGLEGDDLHADVEHVLGIGTPKAKSACSICGEYKELRGALRKASDHAVPRVSKYRRIIDEVNILVNEEQEEHLDVRCAG